MMLRDDRIDEFVQLWERAFGERITRDEARTKAHQLIELYRAISEDVALRNGDVDPPPSAEDSESASPPGGGS